MKPNIGMTDKDREGVVLTGVANCNYSYQSNVEHCPSKLDVPSYCLAG